MKRIDNDPYWTCIMGRDELRYSKQVAVLQDDINKWVILRNGTARLSVVSWRLDETAIMNKFSEVLSERGFPIVNVRKVKKTHPLV